METICGNDGTDAMDRRRNRLRTRCCGHSTEKQQPTNIPSITNHPDSHGPNCCDEMPPHFRHLRHTTDHRPPTTDHRPRLLSARLLVCSLLCPFSHLLLIIHTIAVVRPFSQLHCTALRSIILSTFYILHSLSEAYVSKELSIG